MRRALVLVLALAACGGGGGGGGGADAGPRGKLDFPSPGFWYQGIYPGGTTGAEDDITPAGVQAYVDTVRRDVAWVYFSDNWFQGRAFPLATCQWIRDRGAAPFIRLMLRSDAMEDHAEPVFTLAAIAAGDFDADLDAWGDAAASFGGPLVVEWGTEMNGQWFAWNGKWNGQAAGGPAFVAAYRHIHDQIEARGADQITWVWHVNDADDPVTDWNQLENYYPGTKYVDWLGVSDYGALTPQDTELPAFRTGLDAVVPRLLALAPARPIMVLEFGSTTGNPLGEPGPWASAALGDLFRSRWPQVRGFSWWNETWQNDDVAAHDTDMRVQAIPALGDTFRRKINGNVSVVDHPILIGGSNGGP